MGAGSFSAHSKGFPQPLPKALQWRRRRGTAPGVVPRQLPIRLVAGRPIPPLWSAGSENRSDLWVLPLFGDRKPFPFVATSVNKGNGQFSPDGRWVAYQSNESGRYEVYVQPFPGPGGKWQVSTDGGIAPRWRRDSKELFYIAPNGKLMAVPIRAPDRRWRQAPRCRYFRRGS